MKKLILLIMMVFCIVGLSAHESMAQEQVQIKINGELRNFSPGGRIVSGRTMLPVRYIVEDPAVNGSAEWENSSRRVTIRSGGNEFVFVIDRREATVNGQKLVLDVAPFIYQGRTYLPLRFFAEQMGASVGWKSRQSMVVIQFGDRPLVMGYSYYGTVAELDNQALTDVMFRWLKTDGQGNLAYEYWNDSNGEFRRAALLDRARQNGLKIHASVMLMGWSSEGRAQLHELLSSAENRQRLIENLRVYALSQGCDGINIDMEGIPTADRDNFSLFMQELYQVLHEEGLTVSVAAPAKVAGSSWHAGFDYSAMGDCVDYLIIMAYDYSTSAPGASAPISWVEQVVSYARTYVPTEKIILGIGLYGRDWNVEKNTCTTVYQSTLDQLLASSRSKVLGFDPNTFTPYIDYLDDNGSQHRVWYENRKSLDEKMAVALENNLPGVSFWRLSGAFTDFFAIFK